MSAVDKLIFNCLVQYGNVALPNVGALEITTKSAQKSGNEVAAPQKRIVFSTKAPKEFIPITDMIAEQGSLDEAGARNVYDEWLRSARHGDGTVVIDGVGTITVKRAFNISDELNKALNGDVLPPVELEKRRICWGWWVALGVVVVALLLWLFCPCMKCCCDKEDICITEEVVALEPEIEPFEQEETDITIVPKQAKTAAAVVPQTGKRYNVAVGVFAVKGNAEWCVAQDPLGIGKENYTIMPYPGGMEVVVVYSTDNGNKAWQMMREYREIQDDVWVYTRY